VQTSSGKKGSIYRTHKHAYRADKRRDYWKVCESKKKRLSVKDYAQKYSYSPVTIREMCREQVLDAIKFKGGWLVLDVPVGG